jgi:hypothetical protein
MWEGSFERQENFPNYFIFLTNNALQNFLVPGNGLVGAGDEYIVVGVQVLLPGCLHQERHTVPDHINNNN